MMEEFKKLLLKKAKHQGPVDEKKMSAKAMIMKELSDMLGDGMKDDIVGGLKKVTVASDSPEGLEKGMDLAKKKISELSEGEEESPEEESAESPEEEASEDESSEEHLPEEESSEEEPSDIESEIADLEKKLEELKKKKEA